MGTDSRRDHRRHHRGAAVTRILGISGSLRERSYNTALLREAAELAPPGVEIELFDLSEIPPYNDDVESAGDPEPVARLRAAVADADALLVATPSTTAAPRRPQERDRLALAAGAGLGPALEAGCDHGRLERPRRHAQGPDASPRRAPLPRRGRARGARGGRPDRVGAIRSRPAADRRRTSAPP